MAGSNKSRQETNPLRNCWFTGRSCPSVWQVFIVNSILLLPIVGTFEMPFGFLLALLVYGCYIMINFCRNFVQRVKVLNWKLQLAKMSFYLSCISWLNGRNFLFFFFPFEWKGHLSRYMSVCVLFLLTVSSFVVANMFCFLHYKRKACNCGKWFVFSSCI